MIPGNGRVVLVAEELRALDAWQIGGRAIVEIADESTLPRKAYDSRQERLRDAVRHVGACRFAPFRGDIAAMDDDAVDRCAYLCRSDDFEVWLALAERVLEVLGDILRRGILVRDRVVDGAFQFRRIEAELDGRLIFP